MAKISGEQRVKVGIRLSRTDKLLILVVLLQVGLLALEILRK